MNQNVNTSQDPDYYGPTGHEKKFHKTHFGGMEARWKRRKLKDDPDWEYVGAGRWKYKKKRETRREGAEAKQGA